MDFIFPLETEEFNFLRAARVERAREQEGETRKEKGYNNITYLNVITIK